MRLTLLGFASWDIYATSPSTIFQALTKFLKCVNWDLPQEAKQALELLGKWRPMDVEDSLELLSSQFTNPTVRRYAVARLQQADDEVGRKPVGSYRKHLRSGCIQTQSRRAALQPRYLSYQPSLLTW